MVVDGVEMIIGMQVDPQFGPVILFGLRGIFVEVLRDVAAALAPLSLEEAQSLPGQLQGRAVLQGVRGAPAVDGAVLADGLLRFLPWSTISAI